MSRPMKQEQANEMIMALIESVVEYATHSAHGWPVIKARDNCMRALSANRQRVLAALMDGDK